MEMSDRQRFFMLALIMTGVVVLVTVTSIGILYRAAFREEEARLREMAESNAHVIEAMALHGEENGGMEGPKGSLETILEPMRWAQDRLGASRQAVEFTLAERRNGRIVFLLRHRGSSSQIPDSIPLDTKLALPMRLALEGSSGSVVGLDYRGEKVLAAFEPVKSLNLGMVAKIDLFEVRKPFLIAGSSAMGVTILLLLVSSALFSRISQPIIKTLEERVKEREKLLRQLRGKNKELEQIIYITSHDFRSPLLNIQGFGSELKLACESLLEMEVEGKADLRTRERKETLLKEFIPETLQYITGSVAKMDMLVSGLLKLSRIGRSKINRRTLDMNRILAAVAANFSFRLKERKITLQIDDLPPCYGNRGLIDMLFSNLLDNAVKYAQPDRTGVIKISGRREGDASVYRVEDNGIGIPGNQQGKIFNLFHRLDPRKTEGEGLGLAIVTRILHLHEGTVRVESEAGKGSRFIVTLPGEAS